MVADRLAGYERCCSRQSEAEENGLQVDDATRQGEVVDKFVKVLAETL